MESISTQYPISLQDIWDNMNLQLRVSLVCDCIYLGDLERRRMAQGAHEYLIENIQYQILDNISATKNAYDLAFRNPSKELYWVALKKELINNDVSTKQSFWTNYDLKIIYPALPAKKNVVSINPFQSSTLNLNSNELFDIRDSASNLASENYNSFCCNYFNYYVPFEKHTNSINPGINNYAFSINPEQHQPSGECNFSRILSTTLNFNLDSRMFNYNLSDVYPNITPGSSGDATYDTNVIVYVFTKTLNVLRIISGFGRLAFGI